jgi:P-type Mg2+ transporter
MLFRFDFSLLEYHAATAPWRRQLVVAFDSIVGRFHLPMVSRIPRPTRRTDRDHIGSSRVVHEACHGLELTLEILGTDRRGLLQSEAEARLDATGPNEIARDRPPAWYWQLLSCFKNPFIGVLVLLAAVSYATDDLRGVIILTTMVALSVLLRFWQEFRSLRSAERLKAMVRTTATVLRRDSEDAPPSKREVAMREIVAGDIVQLSAGDMIPADVRLISSRDLFVSQAVLTGEALPVEKHDTNGDRVGKSAKAAADSSDPLDLANVCFMGTNVVSGTASAVVVATGAQTYFGSLAKSIVGQRAQTAFDRGVNSVSWVLIRFMAVMLPIVLLVNGFTKGDWMEAFFFAISVAVGLTPEMLPMIVSANLAKGAVTMSRHKVVVKRLNAIQNFGAMDVLCTDKTGTLTQDKIILERHLDLSGKEDDRVLALGWLNSYHQSSFKNLLDVAVLARADEIGPKVKNSNWTKVDELPFDFLRRRMSVIVGRGDGSHLLVCKGAVEELLAICDRVDDGDTTRQLDDPERERIRALAHDMNEDGFRVILVATKAYDRHEARGEYHLDDEQGLVVRGFLSFLDPPKESAGPAIAALRAHGVLVKILTGDNPIVTAKICREVGLEIGTSVLGKDIDALEDEALGELVARTTVFAKMAPLQKARVIKALQARGHTIGFLGDGINDAPALRDADVGISVDSAADIAKESADIILLEKSLLALEQGVIEGRETFGNIIKYIKMTASSNFGNVFSVLVASAFLPFLPMLPIHLLIQNLLYDISQTAVPFDRVDREYLKTPRQWVASDIARFMLCIGPISSIFDITTFALMWHVFGADSPTHQSLFQSGWFIEGLLTQTLIVHMIRTEKVPFIQSTATLPLLLLTAAMMAIGIAIPFSALGRQIGLVPLPLAYFPWLAATLLSYCLLTQLFKVWYIRRYRIWL